MEPRITGRAPYRPITGIARESVHEGQDGRHNGWHIRGVDPKRSLSRESRLLARLQRDGDERGTAEYHVDPDEQAERPDDRPWQAGDDDTREDQIDDAVYQNPLPFARQLTAMGDGEDDHQNTVDNEISDQHIGKDDQTASVLSQTFESSVGAHMVHSRDEEEATANRAPALGARRT